MNKLSGLIVILLTFFSSICFASSVTYETSTGAIFTQVDSPIFGTSWMDPDGTVWSPVIGRFLNQPQAISNDEITDSQAVNACQKLGARLPTLDDFRRLAAYFDRTSDGVLITDKGRVDLFVLFPEVERGSFWASTIELGVIYYMFTKYGSIMCARVRCQTARAQVKCVH